MQRLRGIVKCVSAAALFIAMTGIFSLTDAQTIYAQVKSESVTGTVYQLAENGYYDIASASQSSSTDASVTDGKFNIAGNISSVTTKNGFPAYSVAGGTLTFSYNYDANM